MNTDQRFERGYEMMDCQNASGSIDLHLYKLIFLHPCTSVSDVLKLGKAERLK